MTSPTPHILDRLDPAEYSSRRVALAMSGGVDSSLSAALLKEAGFEVIGITMLLKDEQGSSTGGENYAASAARSVAELLGIDHETIDFRDRFEHCVIDYFTNEYIAGRTPNPCVFCNRLIKWELLGETARSMGYDLIATGHYARIGRFSDGTCTLLRGIDHSKDQSYFLWKLDSSLLARTLFPLGATTKQVTRERAQSLKLAAAVRPESQEICFIPDNNYRGHLMRRFEDSPPPTMTPGDIVDSVGTRLGTHRGAAFYTIGQRRGLGIAAEHPLFVTKLDALTNTVTVGLREELARRSLDVSDVNWIRGFPPGEEFRATIRIRYRHHGAVGLVTPTRDGARIRFDKSQTAVTPGQSAVFYDGDLVIGGGIIEKALKT